MAGGKWKWRNRRTGLENCSAAAPVTLTCNLPVTSSRAVSGEQGYHQLERVVCCVVWQQWDKPEDQEASGGSAGLWLPPGYIWSRLLMYSLKAVTGP